MIKTIEEKLAEALDAVKAKSAKAAKTIAESDVTVEEKLATCLELVEGATRCGKLTQLIRESSYAFDGPPTTKHLGALDRVLVTRESADETDETNRKLAVVAQRAFNLSEAEALAFAGIDESHDKLKAALMREDGSPKATLRGGR